MIQMRQALYLRLCSAFSSNKFPALVSYSTSFPRGISAPYLLVSKAFLVILCPAVIRTFYSHGLPNPLWHILFILVFVETTTLAAPWERDVLILFCCFELLLSNCWKMNVLYNTQFVIFLPFPSYCSKYLPVFKIILCLFHIVLSLSCTCYFILVICAGLS